VGDRCVGCATCTRDVCFVDAIRVIDGRAVIGQDCRGCGRCVSVCPQEAIELTIEDDWFVTQAIARLAPLVDLS
jgi:ferredoxin